MQDSNKFYNRLTKDLMKKYNKVSFKAEGKTFQFDEFLIKELISMHEGYDAYKNKNKTYKQILEEYSCIIDITIGKVSGNIDYSKIHPILKPKDWTLGDTPEKIFRKRLFLDIDMLFAIDCKQTYIFIDKDYNVDFEKVYSSGLKNLNKSENCLIEIPFDILNVFTLEKNCDYAPSMLFNKHIENEIIKKVGVNFIFTIATSSGLVIAPNIPEYVRVLKELIAADVDPFKVSDRVYGYINGEYCYMD